MALTFSLALPEIGRAHSGIDTVGADGEKLSHQNVHVSGINGISDLCHPEQDCFVTAALSFQPNIKVARAEASLKFSFMSHSHESWMMLFDPPPPKIWS
ncbi:hypothetical protein AKJ29_01085 [Aliiroseovarius crassostreae]|uniref:Uncharacterized protein n=1 Tax=Aliiroseovarius crassostreae TaxID=154981 RepID=A0A0P7KHB6_9RHOB|nr:hypothetical protein [Aliiroseovarius crassostreae]KPN62769.1 hypothetical protein AKJ29_01085 [Aliiroseovarius crassostreae]